MSPTSGSVHVVYKCCMILCVTFLSFVSAPEARVEFSKYDLSLSMCMQAVKALAV